MGLKEVKQHIQGHNNTSWWEIRHRS